MANLINVCRDLGATAAILCGTTAVWASCCVVQVGWKNPTTGAPATPCVGTSVIACEESAPGCTPPVAPAGPNYSCRLTGASRKALCTTYTLGSGGSWLQGPCDVDLGPSYTFVARLPNGACCWVFYASTTTTPVPTLFITDCGVVCQPTGEQ